jgi:hypothetical protein
VIILDIKQEYERIKVLFVSCDDNQLALLDGSFWECARLRVELDNLHKIVLQTGLVRVNPDNPNQQRELPVSKMIVKTRANYLNYIAKLSNILGKAISEEDDDLAEYE